MNIPVALFAYNRPQHLQRTLAGLQANRVPLLYCFSDGSRTDADTRKVEEVRHILKSIDWCECHVVEREKNLGLGCSVRQGVTEVLEQHDRIVVFEDDIVCVPGAYAYMCSMLNHYESDQRVMSVAAWTHPRVRPPIDRDKVYFDGRFACWGWGTWRRSWEGMNRSAEELLRECERRGISSASYGNDIVSTAHNEQQKNVWAVRFALLHYLTGGLCVHPPWSMVENIGFDESGTNTARSGGLWRQATVQECPPMPQSWPEPAEHVLQAELWRRICDETEMPQKRQKGRLRRFMGACRSKFRTMGDPEGVYKRCLKKTINSVFNQWHDMQFHTCLDYGCGSRPYEDIVSRVAAKVIGVDIGENPRADILVGTDDVLPLPNGVVDMVTSFQVMEHVRDYSRYLSEIARVMETGGVLILSVPGAWPYHPHPKDYRRWMKDGLVDDLCRAECEVVEVLSVFNPISTGIQYMLTTCLHAGWSHGRFVRGMLTGMALIGNLCILVSEKCFGRLMRFGPGNHVVVARKGRQERSVC